MAMLPSGYGPGDGRSNLAIDDRDFPRDYQLSPDGTYENKGADLEEDYDDPWEQLPESDSGINEDELMFKLRYAHLHKGFPWTQAIPTLKEKTLSDVLASLREYPLPISTKLELRKRYENEAGERMNKGRRLSIKNWKDQKKKIKKTAKGSIGMINNGFVPFDLWADAIGRIAAYFGTNVASYFRFLRFLVLLNIAVCLIMFLFVSLPQIIPLDLNSDVIKSGFFGLLSNTIFFYGAYSNTTLSSELNDVTYNRPLAYLLTWCCTNILAILIVVVSMYISYRNIKQSHHGKDYVYSSQLLTGWDFTVTSKKGVKTWANAIATYFKEMKSDVKEDLNGKQKCALLCLRLFCNLISVGILGGSCYLIYYVAQHTIKPGLDVPSVINDFFVKYQLTLIVAGLKVVIPWLLSFLLLLERYHPRTQIKLQIARTAVFYVASLVVFLASIYAISTKCVGKNNAMNNNNTESTNITTTTNQENYCCWENEVGEQLFQVVILDLAVSLVLGLVTSGGKALLTKQFNFEKFGESSFDVAELILDLVYGQSLIWLGLYFAPFFGAVAVVKLTVLFYFNYAIAVCLCVPSNNVFKASRSGTFYMFILLVTLFVCLVSMTYAIIKFEPSASCGPFRSRDLVYHVLTEKIGDSPTWLQDIIQYASTPGIIVPLLIVFILVILYYKVRSATHKAEVKGLRNHLLFDRKNADQVQANKSQGQERGNSQMSDRNVPRQQTTQTSMQERPPAQKTSKMDRRQSLSHTHLPSQPRGRDTPLNDWDRANGGPDRQMDTGVVLGGQPSFADHSHVERASHAEIVNERNRSRYVSAGIQGHPGRSASWESQNLPVGRQVGLNMNSPGMTTSVIYLPPVGQSHVNVYR